MKKFGIIGTGNIAGAILGGALSSGIFTGADVLAYDVFEDKLAAFADGHGVTAAVSAGQIASECENILVSVKPYDLPALFEIIRAELDAAKPLIISVAAGTTIARLLGFAGGDAHIVRYMPNINAVVGESMTACCAGPGVTAEQRDFAFRLCSGFGRAVELEEKYFSAYSAIAGCGPAFVYLFIDEMARAGVKLGLSKKLATEIAAQTVLGSAKMIEESDEHPCELIDRVCSPGGTTIEGVEALKENKMASAIAKAVFASYDKDMAMQG